MVELNARILSLLAEYNPEKYAAYLREGVQWLLSTREAWGAWHNEIGTAVAVKALLKAGVFGKEEKSSISITINGKNIGSIPVDPKDPFLSAAKLAYFEITPWLKPGANTITVRYTGKLTASVILEGKTWTTKGGTEADTLEIERSVSGSLNLGEPMTTGLKISGDKVNKLYLVKEKIPSLCMADEKNLEKLMEQKKIIDYSVENGYLMLYIFKNSKTLELTHTLTTVRKGSCTFTETLVLDPETGLLLGKSSSGIVSIQ
jgi:hypothetical protein